MAYEILGETVKSATSLKLAEIFGEDTIRYKESVTNMRYPNFFIEQASVTPTPAGRNRLKLDYLINIRYRIASDINTVSGLQEKLDKIGLKLTTELLDINLERPVKTYNRRYEKIDGVLHFFFNVTLFVIPEQAEEVKQLQFNINEEVI